MNSKLALYCFLFTTLFCSAAKAQVKLDLQRIPASPELLASGLISTGLNERDFAMSPDGTEIYYSVLLQPALFHAIIFLKKDSKGNWSKPEVASFSGHYSDLEPAFSPDGKKIYFSSNRPISGEKSKDFDIWLVERNGAGWSQAKPVSEVNTSANEFYPSIGKSGTIYFTAEYKNGIGKEDIFYSKWESGHFLAPIPLDTNVNSKTYEFNAFVSPDEDLILFSSYGRSDDKGRGDLYISIKNAEGKWQPAKNLALLNSDRLDYCPFVSFDKKILFFTSEKHNQPANYNGKGITYASLQKLATDPLNGGGNIYWVSLDAVLQSLK